MTAPTAESVNAEPEGPIPDDLLRSAIFGRVNANPLDGLLGSDADDGKDVQQDAQDPAPGDAPADQPAGEPEGGTTEKDPQDPELPTAAADQPDPWTTLAKDAAPLTYKMNGQPQTFANILEVPGKGGIIPADKLDEVRNLIARSESNAHVVKDLYALKQDVERLGGMEKFHEQADRIAASDAATELILSAVLSDPTQFVRIENGQIVKNDYMLNLLVKESIIKGKEAQWGARTERTTKQQAWQSEESDRTQTEQAIPQALASFRERYPALTDEDMAAAQAIFGPIRDSLVYKATPEDAQRYGFTVGQPLVALDKMHPWFVERVRWREEQTTQRKASDAATQAALKAAKDNAARTPAAKQKAAPRRQTPRNEAGQFTEREERLDSATMYERALAGRSVRTGNARDED